MSSTWRKHIKQPILGCCWGATVPTTPKHYLLAFSIWFHRKITFPVCDRQMALCEYISMLRPAWQTHRRAQRHTTMAMMMANRAAPQIPPYIGNWDLSGGDTTGPEDAGEQNQRNNISQCHEFWCSTHLPWTRWLPFRRRCLQMHFREWKCLVFLSNLHWSFFLGVQLAMNQHWFR